MRQLLFRGTQFVCALINTCHDLFCFFCWKGGELPECLKFEEHVLEQKLVKRLSLESKYTSTGGGGGGIR